MGHDDSWPATVLSVVPSYSSADSNLIGPAQSGFPMSWFFALLLGRRVLVNSTRPNNLPFSVFCDNRPKWQNRTSDCESDGRF